MDNKNKQLSNRQKCDRIFAKTDKALTSLETQVIQRIFESCVLSEQTQNELTKIMENKDASARQNKKAAISVILNTDNLQSNNLREF